MRHALIAVSAAMILSACEASAPPTPMAQPAPAPAPGAVFPDVFQTAFRAEAIMTGPDGATIPVVLLQDGAKTRIEVPAAEGPVFRAADRMTGETILWQHVRGRAILLPSPTEAAPAPAPPGPSAPPPGPLYVLPDLWWQDDVAASMSQVGACAHLGVIGVEWERDHEDGPQHVCVTADGVVLWATDNGRTVWQLTSLQRGPQEPSQFAPPAGARRPRPAEAEPAEGYDDRAAYVPPPQFSTAAAPPAPPRKAQ